jgi:uncharacterized membrane protein (DUF106 family)
VVVAGQEIHVDPELSEKKRKKLAAKEAKKKRDEMVGGMIKATESGLGAFADMTEMFTKYFPPVITRFVLIIVHFPHLHATPMDMLDSKLPVLLLSLPSLLSTSYPPGWSLGV